MREWVDEENEEDKCGALNKKLNGINESLQEKEFHDVEQVMSSVVRGAGSRPDNIDKIKSELPSISSSSETSTAGQCSRVIIHGGIQSWRRFCCS